MSFHWPEQFGQFLKPKLNSRNIWNMNRAIDVVKNSFKVGEVNLIKLYAMKEDSLVEGDHAWEQAAWDTFDCHLNDLQTIIHIYNSIQSTCRSLLADELSGTWQAVTTYDHRTLYMIRRTLIAAWHQLHFPNQFDLPLREKEFTLQDGKKFWRSWLAKEVRSWIWKPHLTHKITQILRHPNQPAGYIAEDRLTLQLIERFDTVPWLTSLKQDLELNIEKNQKKLALQK
jgi:hypothetical protein